MIDTASDALVMTPSVPLANDATRYLGSKLISLPKMLQSGAHQLRKDNPGIFSKENPIDIDTSIDSLSPVTTKAPSTSTLAPAVRASATKRRSCSTSRSTRSAMRWGRRLSTSTAWRSSVR